MMYVMLGETVIYNADSDHGSGTSLVLWVDGTVCYHRVGRLDNQSINHFNVTCRKRSQPMRAYETILAIDIII